MSHSAKSSNKSLTLTPLFATSRSSLKHQNFQLNHNEKEILSIQSFLVKLMHNH